MIARSLLVLLGILSACAYNDVTCTIHAGLFETKTQFSIDFAETICNPEMNLGLRFHEVVTDSRCPVDVHCIWEGEITVSLNAIQNDAPIATIMLNSRSPVSEVLINDKMYTFTLVSASPPQKRSDPPKKHEYIIELVVEPNGG